MKRATIKLRSNPTLKFMVNGSYSHNMQWDKNHPQTLVAMLKELIHMNYRHHGIEATDAAIAEYSATLKEVSSDEEKTH